MNLIVRFFILFLMEMICFAVFDNYLPEIYNECIRKEFETDAELWQKGIKSGNAS